MINLYITYSTTIRLFTRGGVLKVKSPPYSFDQEVLKYFQQDPSKNKLRCVKINPSSDTYKFNMRTFEPFILNKTLKLLNNLNKSVIRTGMLFLFGNFAFLWNILRGKSLCIFKMMFDTHGGTSTNHILTMGKVIINYFPWENALMKQKR